jgi:homoserine/homoserine lactone efflux protein
MVLELYIGFVLATAVLILIPGPAVSLIVANSVGHGTRGGLATVAGTSTAIAGHLVIVFFGLTSAMLVLAHWFEWLRWAGVAYLVWLGVRSWRRAGAVPTDVPVRSRRRLYWQGFLVSATNPKTLFFYAAFFPQFVAPAAPPGPQVALLCVTFLAIAVLLDGSYALAAGRLRPLLAGRTARLRGRLAGALLIGAGLGLALARRGS